MDQMYSVCIDINTVNDVYLSHVHVPHISILHIPVNIQVTVFVYCILVMVKPFIFITWKDSSTAMSVECWQITQKALSI